MWDVEPNAVSPAEAIAWFRARVSMTPDEYRALEDRARRKAFTVAGVMDLDLLNDTFKALDKAVAQGTTFETFVKDVGEKLEATWGKADSSRLQTIFSTNVQSAYSAGRWRQLTDPDVLAERPYHMYDAVLDGRTSELCKHLDGTTLPADDPFWETHTPPLHFNCRSGIISLTESQAAERGVTKTPPRAPAASGFGLVPDKSEWQPQYAKYPQELQQAYQAAQPRAFKQLEEEELDAYVGAVASMPPGKRGFLTPYTAEQLREKVAGGARVYLTDDGVGYIIDKGDLQGVINASDRKGAGSAAVEDAIRNGARTLDAYEWKDGKVSLPRFYAKFGFRETKRFPWDDSYAPPDWDYDVYGRPDVVLMELNDDDDER